MRNGRSAFSARVAWSGVKFFKAPSMARVLTSAVSGLAKNATTLEMPSVDSNRPAGISCNDSSAVVSSSSLLNPRLPKIGGRVAPALARLRACLWAAVPLNGFARADALLYSW
jgi:hypothetical protein